MLEKMLVYIKDKKGIMESMKPYSGMFIPSYFNERIISELAFINGTNRDLIKLGSDNGHYRLLIDKEGAREHMASELEKVNDETIALGLQSLTNAPAEGMLKVIPKLDNFAKYVHLSRGVYQTDITDILAFYIDLFQTVSDDLGKIVSPLDERMDYRFILDESFHKVEGKKQFSQFAMDHLKSFFPLIFTVSYIDQIGRILQSNGQYDKVEVDILSIIEAAEADGIEVQALYEGDNLSKFGGKIEFNDEKKKPIQHVKIGYKNIEEKIISYHEMGENNPVVHVKRNKGTLVVTWDSFLRDCVLSEHWDGLRDYVLRQKKSRVTHINFKRK